MEGEMERKRAVGPEVDEASEKRRRVDGGGSDGVDLHHCPPSKVLHVRAVPDYTTQFDLMSAMQQFGKVAYVTLMPRVRQALVEMETLDAAIRVVEYNRNNSIFVKGRPTFFNFSKSQAIKRFNESGISGGVDEFPNRILLFTIFNPLYPITTDVIHKICSPHAQVIRIVIFHKNGVQAMVEFSTIDEAVKVREQLDGADIYAGCCTVKIEFSKSQSLNVRANTEETWDINLVGIEPRVGRGRGPLLDRREPLVAGPPPGAYGHPVPPMGSMGFPHGGGDMGGPMGPYMSPPGRFDPVPPAFEHGAYPVMPDPGEQRVLMVYGIPPSMNCQHLFNIFCQYGNVLKCKVLMNKPSTAMVEMDSHQAAAQALRFLHEAPLLNGRLELSFSKHQSIVGSSSSPTLTDGTPSLMDFTSSKNNRFLTEQGSSKNRIIAPTAILHFYNAPVDITEAVLKQLFIDRNTPPPKMVKLFNRNEKSCTGLLEWGSVPESVEGIAYANHSEVRSQTGQLFTLKLAFSPAQSAK